MDFLELCNNRFSVRDYDNKPIEREKIEYILECARMAPSAVNYQPWTFLVVRNEENRIKVQESYRRDWFKTAPCYIIVMADKALSWKRKVDGKDYADVDTSIAAEHLCLAAAEQGLGTCWVCNFESEVLAKNFDIPSHLEPIVIFSLGYPTNPDQYELMHKSRKPITEIVKWEKI